MLRLTDVFSLYSLACVMLPCLVYQLFSVIKKRNCGKKVSGIYLAWVFIFLFYLWMVFDVTGVGTMGDILRNMPDVIIGGVNFAPFDSFGLGFILNIVMFMPFGFLLPLMWKECRDFKKTVLAGLSFSLIIELTQLLNFRATDVDDLMANTCGAWVGYLIWRSFAKFFGERLSSADDGRWEAAVCILLALAGEFFLYNPFLLIQNMA